MVCVFFFFLSLPSEVALAEYSSNNGEFGSSYRSYKYVSKMHFLCFFFPFSQVFWFADCCQRLAAVIQGTVQLLSGHEMWRGGARSYKTRLMLWLNICCLQVCWRLFNPRCSALVLFYSFILLPASGGHVYVINRSNVEMFSVADEQVMIPQCYRMTVVSFYCHWTPTTADPTPSCGFHWSVLGLYLKVQVNQYKKRAFLLQCWHFFYFFAFDRRMMQCLVALCFYFLSSSVWVQPRLQICEHL